MRVHRSWLVVSALSLGTFGLLPGCGETSDPPAVEEDPPDEAPVPRTPPRGSTGPGPATPDAAAPPAASPGRPPDGAPPGEDARREPSPPDGGPAEDAPGDSADRAPAADALGAADLPPPVPCEKARFCENFERWDPGASPGAPWRVSRYGSGTVSIDDKQAFAGRRALKLHVDAGRVSRAFVTTGAPAFPVPGNMYYGRMMVRVSAMPAGSVHWDIIEGTGGGRMFRYGGHFSGRLMANYLPGDCNRISRKTLPTGRWTCVEWQFDGSPDPAGGTKDAMRLWIDGEAITDASIDKRQGSCQWRAPTFSNLAIGWQFHQVTTIPVDMWIDEVAVDTKRVGCPTSR